jgi:hypothetical protein
MTELCIDLSAVSGGPSRDFFRNLLESAEVRSGVTIPPCMVLDHRHPLMQESG